MKTESAELLPLLERIAVAWERQAAANEAIAAGWAIENAAITDRVAQEREAAKYNAERWAIADRQREEDIARREAEREADKQWALDREARDRAGWLSSLTTRP